MRTTEAKYLNALKEIHALPVISNVAVENIAIKLKISRTILFYMVAVDILKKHGRNIYQWIGGEPNSEMAKGLLAFLRQYNNGRKGMKMRTLLQIEKKTYRNHAAEITEVSSKDVRYFRTKEGKIICMTSDDLKKANFEEVKPKPVLTKEQKQQKLREYMEKLSQDFEIID
jgi:hypothetical protein